MERCRVLFTVTYLDLSRGSMCVRDLRVARDTAHHDFRTCLRRPFLCSDPSMAIERRSSPQNFGLFANPLSCVCVCGTIPRRHRPHSFGLCDRVCVSFLVHSLVSKG
jgi:hypothetical protein